MLGDGPGSPAVVDISPAVRRDFMTLDFKRLLCPVDLSTFSLEALKLGVKIAQSSNAGLYVLHVIDNPFDELYMSSITQADPASIGLYKREPLKRSQVLEATIQHSQVLLKQFCQDWVQGVSKVRYLVETGEPFEKIIDVAEEHRIDLIVMSTHGRTGLKRLIIGNVAEKVVRYAPCPVLTIKPRAAKKSAGKR
jgi:nucleotide-binding universal stress UspA family protein